jgi:hypothetical protein
MDIAHSTDRPAALDPRPTVVRRIYAAVLGLLLLAVLAQFYFAAVGAFAKPQDEHSFALHNTNGFVVIPALSVLAAILAAVGRLPARQIVMSIMPAVLVVVQWLINLLGGHDNDRTTTGGLIILGLHALNGLAIFMLAHMIFMEAWNTYVKKPGGARM